jgi:hypothetical protein
MVFVIATQIQKESRGHLNGMRWEENDLTSL